jgi:hypothetical protein
MQDALALTQISNRVKDAIQYVHDYVCLCLPNHSSHVFALAMSTFVWTVQEKFGGGQVCALCDTCYQLRLAVNNMNRRPTSGRQVQCTSA